MQPVERNHPVFNLAFCVHWSIAVAAGHFRHHIALMSIAETTPATTFRIFLQDDKSYGIEVTIPDSFPTTVKSFPSEEAAEAWIANYQVRLSEKNDAKDLATALTGLSGGSTAR